MTRPSRNLDQSLLDAGRRLLPEVGCAGFSLRELASAAGANLGMFHYHFRSRENFLRQLLQSTYDEMFARLEVAAHGELPALENLRRAINVVARFMRDNRRLILRLMSDALAGEAIAAEFLRANPPRHIGVIAGLMQRAQAEGALAPRPLGQALGFAIGAVGLPMLASAAGERGALPSLPLLAAMAEQTLSDAAIAERVNLALAALALPASSIEPSEAS